MRLLLIASLANVPNAVKGLTIPEIVANLCAPGRDVSRLPVDVIARLATAAWYLHTTNDGRLHLRNVQNLVARVTTTAGAYLRDQATKELKERLTEMFKPAEGSCYQRLLPLPAIDEIDVGPERITLVVAEPHPDGLHPDLVTWYEQLTYQNRVGFLTGQRAFDSLLERARELKAINQIIAEMHEEGVADGDAQMQQARETLLPRFLAQFHSAVRETFTTLYYPTREPAGQGRLPHGVQGEPLRRRKSRCVTRSPASRSTPPTWPAMCTAKRSKRGCSLQAVDAVVGDRAPRRQRRRDGNGTAPTPWPG